MKKDQMAHLWTFFSRHPWVTWISSFALAKEMQIITVVMITKTLVMMLMTMIIMKMTKVMNMMVYLQGDLFLLEIQVFQDLRALPNGRNLKKYQFEKCSNRLSKIIWVIN